MGSKLTDVSKKTGLPEEVLKILASSEGLEESADDFVKKLTLISKKAISDESNTEFKLKTVGEILGLDHEDVLKASVKSGARLSKDAGGEFWVVGAGLVLLINTLYGTKVEKVPVRDEKIGEVSEMKQIELSDLVEVPEGATAKTEGKKAAQSKAEAASKPSAKTGKAALKALITSGKEMEVSKARKFLVQSKLRKLEEVAFMSDAEVSKIVNKDYAFLTVGNDTEQLSIAVPMEEIKKIDLSKVSVL